MFCGFDDCGVGEVEGEWGKDRWGSKLVEFVGYFYYHYYFCGDYATI